MSVKCSSCAKWRPCTSISRFRDVLASLDGTRLNAAEIGRRLGVSRTTAMTWIHAYEKAGLLRLLPSLGTRRSRLLVLSPGYGSTASAFGIGGLLEILAGLLPDCTFHWWKTRRTRVVPLVARLRSERIGFSIARGSPPRPRDILPLRLALRQAVVQRGFVLHDGEGALCKDRAIVVLPLRAFLEEPREWVLCRRSPIEFRESLWRINRERMERLAALRPPG